MSNRRYNVLFLCTGNSARSILAEAMLNAHSAGRFTAYSAGSYPAGRVNPFALELLQGAGLATHGLRSKPWEEFAAEDSPRMDFILTVCDQAAGEACPVWPGHPVTAHWGVPDPAACEGSDEDKRRMFRDTAAILRRRIDLLASLPVDKLDRMALQQALREVGKASG